MTLELGARLVLAGVFLAASVSKLADRRRFEVALGDIGVAPSMTPHLAFAVPFVEVVVAGAVLPDASARVGAVAAFVLLVAFTVILARAVAQQRGVDCGCFGPWSRSEIGARMLARNVLLAGVAAVTAVAAPSPAVADAWPASLGSALIVSGATVLGIWLVRSRGRLGRLSRGRGNLPSKAGQPRAPFLHDGRPSVLLFVTANCDPCGTAVAELARWQERWGGRITATVVTDGADGDYRGLRTLRDPGRLAKRYAIPGTPALVVVDGDRQPPSLGLTGIRARLTELDTACSAGARGTPATPRAPSFRLTSLAGDKIALDDLREPGLPIVLVFSEPRCGACAAMIPHLARWRAGLRGRVTFAVLTRDDIASGAPPALPLPADSVLVQEGWEVAEAYGVEGTPAAVVVRPDGRLGSAVALGGGAIARLITSTAATGRSSMARAGA